MIEPRTCRTFVSVLGAHTSRTAAENVNNIITLFLHSSPARSRNNACTAAAAVVTAAAVLEKNRGSPSETSVPQCCQRRRSPIIGVGRCWVFITLARSRRRLIRGDDDSERARAHVPVRLAAKWRRAPKTPADRGWGGGGRAATALQKYTVYHIPRQYARGTGCSRFRRLFVCVCVFVSATTKIGIYSFEKFVFLAVRARPTFFCFPHWFVSLGFVHTVRKQFFST